MAEKAKQSSTTGIELDIYNEDFLVIKEVRVRGLGYVPNKKELNAYWPCTVKYSGKSDVDQHMIGIDGIEAPLAKANLYISECSSGLITPGVYERIKGELYNGFPVYEKK